MGKRRDARRVVKWAVLANAVAVVSLCSAGAVVSDGSLNVLPVGSKTTVRTAWQQHTALVRRSLERGFYQGWDLHPAQLPSRYAATYAFYREGLPAAAARLRDHAERSRHGQEEPATIKALTTNVLRALDCGATNEQELTDSTGLARQDLTFARRTGRLPTGGL